MKYNSKVLNRISAKYLWEEIQEDEEDLKNFMAMFDENGVGILDDNDEDVFGEKERKERWKHIRMNWSYHVR